MNREEYEAKKKTESARQMEQRESAESDARARCIERHEAELAKIWFFRHPDKTVKYTGYLQLFTAVLASATVALVGATIYTAVVLKGTDEKIGEQVRAMGRQLTLIEADQRPWVSAKIEISGDVSFNFPVNGGTFPLHFTLKNSGKSPALYVVLYEEIIPVLNAALPIGSTTLNINDILPQTDPIKEMEVFCAAKKRDDQIKKNAGLVFGDPIFPGDNIPIYRDGRMKRDDIAESHRRASRNVVRPLIIFCINYFAPGDPKIHQTTGLYEAYRIDMLHAYGIHLEFVGMGENVKREETGLDPQFSGSGIAE